MKNIFLLGLLFAVSCFSVSCSSSTDVLGCDTDKINSLSSDILEKASAYGLDPSTENCQNYKATIEEYLDELDKCDSQNEAELEEVRDALEALDC